VDGHINRTSENNNVKGSYYRVIRERLLPKSDGNDPVKLLYPKSKYSRSFNSPISFGIFPEKELLRKILQKASTSNQFVKERNIVKYIKIKNCEFFWLKIYAYIDFM
jgi:hypothetical protein